METTGEPRYWDSSDTDVPVLVAARRQQQAAAEVAAELMGLAQRHRLPMPSWMIPPPQIDPRYDLPVEAAALRGHLLPPQGREHWQRWVEVLSYHWPPMKSPVLGEHCTGWWAVPYDRLGVPDHVVIELVAPNTDDE
ncbi:hypothetical protein [Prauserella marina]|nr:hypothetical protein [Prauserella marina]